MTKKLVVHIGTPKTGSSSLQRALHSGAFSTGRVRVAYPGLLNEVDLARALAEGREDAAARRLGAIDRWLRSTDADVFALSSEHFVGVPPRTFAAALRQHLPDWSARTEVVCYLRPHGPRLVSAFAQQRKSGVFLGSLDDFIRAVERGKRLQYAGTLAAWRDVYGDRFMARLMSPSALVGGDVVADFLHVATAGDAVDVRAQRLNPSLTVEALALLGIVHRALRATDVPSGVAHRLGKRIAADLGATGVAGRGQRLRLSAPEAERVASIFAADAARLDATFYPGSAPLTDDLQQLAEQAPAAPSSLRPGSYADRRTRRSIRRAATTLAAVSIEHGRPWVAGFRAEKGYRHDSAAVRPESVAQVDAALERVVSSLAAALHTLPDRSGGPGPSS